MDQKADKLGRQTPNSYISLYAETKQRPKSVLVVSGKESRNEVPKPEKDVLICRRRRRNSSEVSGPTGPRGSCRIWGPKTRHVLAHVTAASNRAVFAKVRTIRARRDGRWFVFVCSQLAEHFFGGHGAKQNDELKRRRRRRTKRKRRNPKCEHMSMRRESSGFNTAKWKEHSPIDSHSPAVCREKLRNQLQSTLSSKLKQSIVEN